MLADVKTSLFADVFSTDPDAKSSTHSPGETAITPSSVPLVSPVPDDHSDQSTPAVDRGKFCGASVQ